MRIRTLTIAMLATAAALTACNSGSKNHSSDEWVIENDVWNFENIDLEEIADIVDIKPIKSDEPIDELRLYMSGNSNDFIIGDSYHRQTFYHVVNGQVTEKLHTPGNGPTEYNYLDCFSYLPADSLLYGFDRRGRIMCFKTSPFKFVSYYPTDYKVNDMIALGRNRLLITAMTPSRDSCAIYEFDGETMTKLTDMNGFGRMYMFPSYSRSGDDLIVTTIHEYVTAYQYNEGQMQKVATFDNGDMELTKDKQYEIDLGNGYTAITFKDFAIACYNAQFDGSTLAYWYKAVLNQHEYRHLAIATRDSVHNYEVHIGGLITMARAGMIDNGVYTMLIQGGWEGKINPDEELSATGKRIIEALKNNNDGNPIYMQFRLKDKYLNKN